MLTALLQNTIPDNEKKIIKAYCIYKKLDDAGGDDLETKKTGTKTQENRNNVLKVHKILNRK